MNILIISQYFWPENFQINGFAKSLLKKGFQITVLTGLPNYPSGKIYPGYKKFMPYREKWEGIDIIRIPIISRGYKSSFRLACNYLSFSILSSLLVLFLCRKKYTASLVFAPSPIFQAFPSIVLKWFKKIPNFLWVQDLWPESLISTQKMNSTYLLKLVGKVVAFIYRHISHVLVPSNAFEANITSQYKLKKISYFPNSVESIYAPVSVLPNSIDHFQLPEGFKILFAGNIGSAQSIPTILAAAEKLKLFNEIKWIFVGEGSERIKLEKDILENGLQNTVFWKGAYPVTDMPFLFSACDVLLVSLIKSNIFSLTVPSKLQSYLGCGKPVLASIDGESQKIIKEARAGLSAPAQNAELLADCALTLYQMPLAERKQLGINGYKYTIENYDQSKLIDQLTQWLLDIK